MVVSKNSEISVPTKLDYDRASEVKAFDDIKDGVKGLVVDAGVTKIPRIFHQPLDEFEKDSASSSTKLGVPSIDLEDVHKDPTRRKVVVENL
ncbi:Isopenicillin N synthase-like [Sesbania bispinosa]|nr:Isopenicillin N synthase-like [Sesbania bispinosa]